MSEQNKAIVRRLVDDLYNQKKFELFDQFFHPDFRNIGPGPSDVKDLIDYREHTKTTFSTFPDMHMEIQDMIAEGDSVAVIWRTQGTFKVGFMGIPANNQRVTWLGITVHRFLDGKIKESIWGFDDLHAAQLIGMVTSVVPAVE